MKFVRHPEYNGQSQCRGCKLQGKWKVEWSSMMWECDATGRHYCDECKKRLEQAKYVLLSPHKTPVKNVRAKLKHDLHFYLKYYKIVGKVR